jgi:antitoxin CcdA
MATPLRKEAEQKPDREMLRKLMELPLDEFRAARAKRSPAEREELERLWQEENAEAIRSSNEWVEKHGLPLEKYRPF